MPRVRWSLVNRYHSPPTFPSPSSSLSSVSSDGPPILPASYAGLPGPTPFAPQFFRSTPRIPTRAHDLIALSNHPLLHYDVALPPSSISTRYRGVPTAALLDPATSPPQIALTLTSPCLPWPISVAATNARYVTVSDVLSSVYFTLRATATHTEFLTLRAPLRHLVFVAYRQRCERVRGRGRRGCSEERQVGIRRVDFLVGYTRFSGISPGRSSDVWQLHIS
ncbi:hypothetical protein C8R46DRAFT_904715 [Mycena filopes]|nr:hypothetical protein C8R46DRAFT_904715 [Mycena filopes]